VGGGVRGSSQGEKRVWGVGSTRDMREPWVFGDGTNTLASYLTLFVRGGVNYWGKVKWGGFIQGGGGGSKKGGGGGSVAADELKNSRQSTKNPAVSWEETSPRQISWGWFYMPKLCVNGGSQRCGG